VDMGRDVVVMGVEVDVLLVVLLIECDVGPAECAVLAFVTLMEASVSGRKNAELTRVAMSYGSSFCGIHAAGNRFSF
jgi:hypothetical protein